MRRLSLQIILLLLTALSSAQSFDTSKYAFVRGIGNGLYLVGVGGRPEKGDFKNTKIGFLSENGTVVLPPVYSEIGEFVNGMAFIRIDDKYGFINDKFQVVIPCEFSGVGTFNEYGLVWVNKGGSTKNTPGVVSGGKFGVFDANGNVIVPVKYEAIGTFLMEPSEFGSITRNSYVAQNSYFMKNVHVHNNYDIHEYAYLKGRLFQTLDMRLAPYIVCSQKGEFSGDGIFDAAGHIILPEGKFGKFFCPRDGMVPLMGKTRDDKITANYYNVSTGKLVLKDGIVVDCITPYVGKNAILAIKDNYVIIDDTGNQVTRENYLCVFPSSSGTYVTANANGFGMVDSSGNEIFPCCFYLILPDTDGLFAIQEQKGGKIGFINASGDYVIPPVYKNAVPFRNGSALVNSDSGWGIIDVNGNTTLECKWQNIIIPNRPSPDFYWVQPHRGNSFFCLDASTGAFAFSQGYTEIYSNFDVDFEGISFVGDNNGKCGAVSKNGEQVIPMIMDNVSQARELYKTMRRDGKKKLTQTDLLRMELKNRQKSFRYPVRSIIDGSNWDY